MWSSTCAWAREVHVGCDWAVGPVGVVAPEPELQRREEAGLRTGVQRLAKRTMNRVPSGQPVKSMRSLSSATVAPSRSSPVWVSAGAQRDSSAAARLIAALTCGFVRATTANPMLRARNSVARRALHPAESARTCTARRTDLGSSPTWWPAAYRAGSCPIAASSTAS